MAQVRLLGWAIVAPLALACGSGPGPARVEARTPLADETQVSELLGFSLQQALPPGEHVSSLTWNASRDPIEFSPSETSTVLRWSLRLPEGEPPSIEQVDVECDRERFITNVEALCADRLDAKLRMHLESDDGALSEDIPVSFSARAPGDADWQNNELDFAGFAGNFTFSTSGGLPASLRLGLFGNVVDGELQGSLVGDVLTDVKLFDGGYSKGGAVVNVAQWGDTGGDTSAASGIQASQP